MQKVQGTKLWALLLHYQLGEFVPGSGKECSEGPKAVPCLRVKQGMLALGNGTEVHDQHFPARTKDYPPECTQL